MPGKIITHTECTHSACSVKRCSCQKVLVSPHVMFLCLHKCLTSNSSDPSLPSCSVLWHWKEPFIIPHKSCLQTFLFPPHILIKGWLCLFRNSSKLGFASAPCVSGPPACRLSLFCCSGWGFPILFIKTVAVPCPADLHCFTDTDCDELVDTLLSETGGL